MEKRLDFPAPGHDVTQAPPGRWAVAIAGTISLAMALGIGRFAFTPLLPMMLHDGVIDLHGASWLASANYLGYMLGALLCTFQPWLWRRLKRSTPIDGPWIVRAGLVLTGLLTLGMAVPIALLWPLLRLAAGVASAVVFVYTSGWCLAQLAQRDAAALGGMIYTGPGVGIVVSGLFASAMVHWDWRAATGWVIFGLLVFAFSAAVWRIFLPGSGPAAPSVAPVGPAAVDVMHGRSEMGVLALAYGIAGFGYIVTATFLPVIARVALPGSPWLDLFWPIFGLGVVLGASLSTRMRVSGDLRLLLAASYAVQACGIGISILSPSLTGFALGSLLLGIPFTAITFFAMQEVRRLRPALAASFMGLLTAVYGLGQIAGPPMVAWLLKRSTSAGAGFTLSLEVAGASLLAGSVLYLWMVRAYPMRRRGR